MIASLLLAVTIVAHEPGYYTSLSKHVQRWLQSEDVSAEVVTPKEMASRLENEKLAFLVGFDKPTAAELKTLEDFSRRGGKMVVFYSSSPKLAQIMGVKVLGYRASDYPGKWSRMDFTSSQPEGCPKSILQTSSVLQRATTANGRGRIIATWKDRAGRDTGDAAWIATAGGYWMTHVLLADGDEALKAQLLAAIAGSVDPGLWSHAKAAAKKAAAEKSLREYALKQIPRKGEIHAVWDHSGCGLYPGDWPRTMRFLQEARITDLFVNVAGAGFAHYPSDVLPRSKTYESEGDQLAKCLAAAKGTGIRVHAWILCFNATRSTPDRLETFRKRGWRLKDRDGKLTEYLDPSNAAAREYILGALDEIRGKYRVDGIHLDFVRWYERSEKPKDAAETISKFVADARRRVKKPVWLTAAVLGKYPSCVAAVGQDWYGWLDSGIVDYAVPMDYTEDMKLFSSLVAQHSKPKTHARKTIAGIGVTANESRLDARQVIDQINLARKNSLAGVALFDLDVTFEKQIVPYLKLGIW